MSILREIPPTAGSPLKLKDLFLSSQKPGTLEEDFKNYLNAPFARVTYSGTAAFYLILEAIKAISPKKTVIIPAFVCPLVPLAIKRAGLNIEICDIQHDNFNFDYAQLEELCSDNPDILAIVAVHLAGLPVNLDEISRITKKYGLFLIEDCAQSLGATYKDKKVGAIGDFSFFSLCRGKGITIYEGGVLIADNPSYIKQIENTIKSHAKEDLFSESLKVLELFGYWIFYRPLLFWWVFRLPQIFWHWRGQPLKALIEYFSADFPLHKVSNYRQAVGHAVFLRLDKEIKRQRQVAAYLIEGIKNIPGIKVVMEGAQTQGTYPYLTLVFEDGAKHKKALGTLTDKGLGVSQIYAFPLTGYEYLKEMLPRKDYPNAWFLSKREITLTTSTFLKERDLDLIIDLLKNL